MKSNWLKNNWLILVTGLVIGIAALVLGAHGNPGNMGFCIACFLRDTTGALGLHGAEVVQYFRPEIVGIGGGDWNALVGLVGFIVGILVGVVFLKKGFTLGRSYKQTLAEGAAFPVVYVLLFVLWLAAPSIFKFSEKGPGSMHAAWGLALVAGALAQKSRLCMVGGIRNAVMFKDFGLVAGFVTIILTVLVGNLILGKFNPGFTGQPVAHNDGLWNFLGTALMGWGCVLLGGCPLRQLILASSADGPTGNGKIAVIVGFVVVLVVSLLFTKKAEE